MMFNRTLQFLLLFVCTSVAVSFATPLTAPTNKHNLSNQSSNDVRALDVASGGTDQICVFCHTPHSATPDSTLWSRPDPATGTFDLYGPDLVISGKLVPGGGDSSAQVSNSQYTNTDPAITYPNGSSRMCLSCHDGVTAIGLLNDNTTINMSGGTTLINFATAGSAIIELSTSHPISFKYDTNVLADLTAYYGADSYEIPNPDPASLNFIDVPLDGQKRMQCTTCHDPHNDTRDIPGGIPPFWRQTVPVLNVYDDVCNACHTDAGFSPGGPTGDHQLP